MNDIIKQIIKRKCWKEIVGYNYELSNDEIKEIESIQDKIKDNLNYIKIVANFVKYNLIDYDHRLQQILLNRSGLSEEMFIWRFGEIEGSKRYFNYIDKLKNKKRPDKLTLIQNSKIWKDVVGKDYILSDNDKNLFNQIIQKYQNINIRYAAESIKYQIPLTIERYKILIQNPYKKNIDYFKFRFGEEGLKKYNECNYCKKLEGISIIRNSVYFKNILGDYLLNDNEISEINSVIDLVNSHLIIKIILNFIKYNLNNYRSRMLKILSNSKSLSCEHFILRYGKEEGLKRYDIMCKKLSISHSEEFYIEKFGIDGIKIFNDIQEKKKITKENLILKYGSEIGNQKWEDFCQRNKGNWTLERQVELYGKKQGRRNYQKLKENVKFTSSLEGYIDKHGLEQGKHLWLLRMKSMWFNGSKAGYIQKYGKEEGLIIMRERKNNTSLESFIKRYGENKGKEKYQIWLEKVVPLFSGWSKIASYLFQQIHNNFSNLISNILYQPLTFEFSLFDTNLKRSWFYDFVIPSIKYCIEFNGDIWHANPNIYKSDDKPHPFELNTSASELWERDNYKINFLKSQGYQVDVIWESDYNNDQGKVFNECILNINRRIEEFRNV